MNEQNLSQKEIDEMNADWDKRQQVLLTTKSTSEHVDNNVSSKFRLIEEQLKMVGSDILDRTNLELIQIIVNGHMRKGKLKKDPAEDYRLIKIDYDILGAKLAELKTQIIEQYEEDPDSVTSVVVVPVKGKKTVSWAKVAEEAKVADSIISKYTKIGKPSYTIKQKTAEQEKIGDGKFISA